MRKEYLNPIEGIESLSDSVTKFAQNDLAQQEVDMAQQALTAAQEKKKQEDAKRNAVDARANAGIEGTDKEGSSAPTEQPGTVLPATAPPPISKTWFTDNFGMTGRELSEILIKAKDLRTLDSIQGLLKMEKQAIISHFKGVSPNLVDELPLTDIDYDALNKHSDRLDLPFRRFVKTWTSSDEQGREKAAQLWSTTIDKSERLSNRERNLLTKCREVIYSRGALNAQTLKSYGIQASPAEISSLIKSHGFLFDLISVGQFSKSVGRGLFYDIKRRDVLIKDADRFIAGLIENNSKFKMDTRLNPRIELGFHAPTAPWYADALCKELDTTNITSSSSKIIINGESTVKKALELAEPYLNGHSPDARKMLKGLRGDKDALLVLAYESMTQQEQIELLKSQRINDEEMTRKREAVLTNG
jgi:hypothetical protein